MSDVVISDAEILQYLQESGIFNLGSVQDEMMKIEREKMLKQHKHSIWQSSDGRWCTYVYDETKPKNRRKVARLYREDLEAMIIASMQEQEELLDPTKMTIAKLYPKWIEYKKLHTTASTYITRVEQEWRKFYIGTDIIDKPIVKFTKLDMDEWAHGLIRNYNMTKNEYYNCTVIMRQTLDYAVDLDIISDNPLSKVKIDSRRLFRKVRKKSSQTQVFSKEEVLAIEQLAWKEFYDRYRVYELAPLALLFQFQTGLRIGELCALRYEDLENDDYIHVQRMVRRDTGEVVDHTKTDYGDRDVYLTANAKKIIEFAKERQNEFGKIGGEYIFTTNGVVLHPRNVASLYRCYCKKLGIENKSSHKARKTYISALIDGNVNINTIRELVGHADERTTYSSYVFDRSTDEEKKQGIEEALDIVE
jgi:integrase